MGYSKSDTDREEYKSYKLIINGKNILSGSQWDVERAFKQEVYNEPFRKFKIEKCKGKDFIIAGITNEVTAKLYKLILTNEDAMEVVEETFRKVLSSVASDRNGYSHNMDNKIRECRCDVSQLCDIYNELYGTDYDSNHSEAWDGNNFQDSDWKRDEENLKGKTKINLLEIKEFGNFMANHMVKEAIKQLGGIGKENYDSYKEYKLNLPS